MESGGGHGGKGPQVQGRTGLIAKKNDFFLTTLGIPPYTLIYNQIPTEFPEKLKDLC